MDTTRLTLLDLLKREGPQEAQALALRLGLSTMGVRQHLWALQAQGWLTYAERSQGLGRPAKLWQLTVAADSLFPQGYQELLLGVLRATEELWGSAGVERVLAVRADQQQHHYQTLIPTEGALGEKLTALAQVRTEEGYMAQVERLADGAFLFIENHCPIRSAAQLCGGLCHHEQEIFGVILGQGIRLERTEHLLSGQRRCVYRVWEAS